MRRIDELAPEAERERAPVLRVMRFLHGYARHPHQPVVEEEVTLEVDGVQVEGTVIRPGRNGVWPGWIILHGITVPGRHHLALKRFARSVASTGGLVLIPDVPAWRELRIDPSAADHTIQAAAGYLRQRPDVDPEDVRLVGFSFGATQALISSTRPHVREAVQTVVGFGGYCDLRRTVLCNLTGEHEWEGRVYRLQPDPYGRWIVAGNYLTRIPGYEGYEPVARAAHRLAMESGIVGAMAWDPVYDATKARLRESIPEEQRPVWDLLAPPAGTMPPMEPARSFAEDLAAAMLATHPELDPAPVLPAVDRRVVLAHGYDDRLIPFTEMLRLRERVPPRASLFSEVTRLFAHSTEAEGLRAWEYPGEAGRYLRLLNRVLGRG